VKAYYIDFKDGDEFQLIAGPFRSEAAARKYEGRAAEIAMKKITLLQFLQYGVVAIEGEYEPGPFNGMLDIDLGDLLQPPGCPRTGARRDTGSRPSPAPRSGLSGLLGGRPFEASRRGDSTNLR